MRQANRGRSSSACFVALFRFLANPREYFDTGSQLGRWNVGQQFMSKFVRGGFDRGDNALGALAEVHYFASAIVRRALPRHPTFSLQPVQQRYNAGFFHAEPCCNFRLRECVRRQWTNAKASAILPGLNPSA